MATMQQVAVARILRNESHGYPHRKGERHAMQQRRVRPTVAERELELRDILSLIHGRLGLVELHAERNGDASRSFQKRVSAWISTVAGPCESGW